MVFNVEWGDSGYFETEDADEAKQKAKDNDGKVILTQDNMEDEQVYPDPYVKKTKPKKKITKLKKKIAKVRKADQQDINRVKRWDSRSFNKKKELSGPTEPVFKPTAATNPLTGRPHPGMRGDELTANLRNRLAKLTSDEAGKDYDPEADIDFGYDSILKNKRKNKSKVKKANGGVAPNYNNPSKVRKKKTATKAAAKSKTGYLGDASVNIPWGEEEVNITFRDMAQFHRKNMWTQKQGTYPQIWNLGPLTGEGQGARQIFDAAHDVENRFIEDMGEDNYQKNMQSEIDHLIKEYGEDPEGDLSFNEELTRTQDNLGLGGDVPQSRRNEIKRRQKKEKMGRQRKALKSHPGRHRKRVNPIKPTKTYKDTINPQEEDPKRIEQNATTIGRKPTYTGKARKRLAKFSDWKPKKGKYPVVHPEKYSTGGDLLDTQSAVRDYKKGLFTPEDEMKMFSQLIKYGMPRGYKGTSFGKPDIPAFEQAMQSTMRTGVISPAGEINWEQFEDLVGQMEKGLGEGKTTDEIAETAVVKKVRPPKPTDKDRGDVMEAKLRNKIARIRKATEQIDPRVKKRKTVRPDSPVQKVSQMKDRIAELKTAKEHSHSIAFRKHEGQYYRRASLSKQEGKYAKYWLLNAKQTNGNGWGVSPVSIAKNINKFIGRPFVVTAKQWIAESEYGDQFEHPYLPTNNIDNIINHQEKFRVGSIVDVVEKDGDYHAVIEINSKFANMMLPPFCSPAIFQNNPGEADGEISDWEALHLAGLMEDPAYGARIALLKGSCMGTAEACSIQFKAAKQTTMCPKKKAKLVRRIDRLGD